MKHLLSFVITAMFGLPAALGLLSRMFERLNVSRLLERLILGYKEISEYLWSGVADYLPYVAQLNHLNLSFLFIITASTACSLLFQPVIEKWIVPSDAMPEANVRMWLSVISLFVISFAMGAIFLFVPVAILALWNRKQVHETASFIVIGYIFFVAVQLSPYEITGIPISMKNLATMFFITALLTIVIILVFRYHLMGPAIILLTAIGIYVIDWLAINVILPLSELLDRAGA